MLLWLTRNENLGLFDFLIDEKGMVIKKLSGEFLIKNFIIYDMKNLDLYSYLAIDVSALKDPIEDIIDGIKAFKAMYDSTLIFFAENGNNELLNRIINETNCYNIITSSDIEKIQEEIRMCVSSQGMSRDYILKTINKDILGFIPKYSFAGENIKIMVAGAMNRIGTTTNAINMANFLANAGAKVSYTEGNGSNHLSSIHSHFFFNNLITNNYFTDGKVDYYLNGNIPINNYNFNIIDIGVLTARNLKLTEIGDINILCAGSKPYELPYLNEVLRMVKEMDKFNIILPVESKVDVEKIDEFKDLNINFVRYSPLLFDKSINADVWEVILSSCL